MLERVTDDPDPYEKAVSWHQVGTKSRQGGTVNEDDG